MNNYWNNEVQKLIFEKLKKNNKSKQTYDGSNQVEEYCLYATNKGNTYLYQANKTNGIYTICIKFNGNRSWFGTEEFDMLEMEHFYRLIFHE